MIKKLALTAAVAATLCSTGVAHAGYNETFNNFRGNFLINNFEDGNKKFSISLKQLDGTVSLKVPAAGTYAASITPGSSVVIDYNGAQGADFLIPPLPIAVPVGSGTIAGISGLAGISSMDFNFNGIGQSTFVLNGLQSVPAGLPARHVDISGSGATSFFSLLFGIPLFLTQNISGTLGVDIGFKQDELNFVIDSTGLVGTNLEALMKSLDDAPGSLNDGQIDGRFAVNGTVNIPEPGSLALLGLGLAGIAARRRIAAKAA